MCTVYSVAQAAKPAPGLVGFFETHLYVDLAPSRYMNPRSKEPVIVDVGGGDHDPERAAVLLDDDVLLGPRFGSISGIRSENHP